MTTTNIASHLPAMAKLDPKRKAIIAPHRLSADRVEWRHLAFGELDEKSDAWARGLAASGVTPGTRVVVMAPPSLDFFPLVFGLFKAGAVLVLIDPGMPREGLLQCLTEVEPEVFIGVPAAQLARRIFSKPFSSTRLFINVGPRIPGLGMSHHEVLARGAGSTPFVMATPKPGETAAILFTSGSTGVAKGAVYTHEMFDAQVRTIRRTYGIEPGEIDCPTFPLFAIFDPALGMTAVLPEMDFRSPAKADPARIVEAITTHRCTTMFASPALLDNLSRYGVEQHMTLPTLRRVLCAGAPVRTDVLERMQALLVGEAQVFTPYGATEALPVASIGSREVLSETAAGSATGSGLCVGRPVSGLAARIITITDEPIATWSDALLAPPHVVGEIAVAGAQVTQTYFKRDAQTKAAKILDGERVIHRMGDLGFFDEKGRLWMCGRKAHRVETASGTIFSVQVEEVFNQHPAVKRAALLGFGPRGSQHPVLLIEKEPSSTMPNDVLLAEVKALAAKFAVTKSLTDFRVASTPFPVDPRHNAKIDREALVRRLEHT